MFANGVQDPRFQLGMKSLQNANRLEEAGLLPAQAAIYFSSTNGIPVAEAWWRVLGEKVQGRLLQQDYNALYALIDCRIDGPCKYDAQRLGEVLKTAREHHPGDPNVATFFANYALNLAGDMQLGLRLMQEAVTLAPRNQDYWTNLSKLLIFLRRQKEAGHALERIWELERYQPETKSFQILRQAYHEAFYESP